MTIGVFFCKDCCKILVVCDICLCLDLNIGGMISTFMDDLKIGSVVENEEGCQSLQQDINQTNVGQSNDKWNLIPTSPR